MASLREAGAHGNVYYYQQESAFRCELPPSTSDDDDELGSLRAYGYIEWRISGQFASIAGVTTDAAA